MSLEFSALVTAIIALGLLLAVTGNMLLNVAIWRSGTLPRWAGLIWAAATLIFYVLGAALGMATTGASLPTQPIGAVLMAISGAWITWSAFRHDTDTPNQYLLPPRCGQRRTAQLATPGGARTISAAGFGTRLGLSDQLSDYRGGDPHMLADVHGPTPRSTLDLDGAHTVLRDEEVTTSRPGGWRFRCGASNQSR
jgi:hypothetical protein